MGIVEYILGGLLAVFSVLIIIVIILQEGNQKDLGVVSGGADTFFSKHKARSIDAKLARLTKFFAAGFVLFVIALNVLAHFLG
ncbi:MAG: preprotein translocase subunit SecG [bacterium]|nr:preprotein translocase subunit SecG [bacterium]MDD6224970.1 preprotein translocase subunit SecG [bacterium]MDY3861337.1 preprotein translocase subunit SecG [Ruminococcus sp.]